MDEKTINYIEKNYTKNMKKLKMIMDDYTKNLILGFSGEDDKITEEQKDFAEYEADAARKDEE